MLCSELAALAQHWAQAGLTLTRPQLGAPVVHSAAHSNTRTTDEISILYLNSVLYGLGTGVWLDVLSEPKQAAAQSCRRSVWQVLRPAQLRCSIIQLTLVTAWPASAVTGMYIGLEEGITWTLWNQARVSLLRRWQGKTVATLIWVRPRLGRSLVELSALLLARLQVGRLTLGRVHFGEAWLPVYFPRQPPLTTAGNVTTRVYWAR